MHLPDLPGVLAFLDNIVVELIPETCGSELWPRDLGKWIEIHAIDVQSEDVEDIADTEQFEQSRRVHD